MERHHEHLFYTMNLLLHSGAAHIGPCTLVMRVCTVCFHYLCWSMCNTRVQLFALELVPHDTHFFFLFSDGRLVHIESGLIPLIHLL